MVRAFVAALSVILFLHCVVVQGDTNFSVPRPFIISGPAARIEDFPYAISLRRNGIHVGGGAVISNIWALSAAHILLGCPASQLSVRAGSGERLIGGSLHNANQLIIHNLFEPRNLNNNVALIGVLEPFIFSDTLSAIALDIQGTLVAPGTEANVAGFGVVMPATNNISPVLRFNTMTVQEATACQDALSSFLSITSNMLCTTSTTHNPCHGDFGGALVANGRLVGVASWNPFCTHSGYSTAFTRIAAVPIRSFIRGVVGF